MAVRNVVSIDEEKCDGCGECVPACAEGAIQIVDGKARLISETYCDGLGACLGECPQDAITIEEREAEEFDEDAVRRHLEKESAAAAEVVSRLGNWPVQIQLLPAKAPYFEGASLLIAADCVPFAYADFHSEFLEGKTLLIGCTKLDSAEFYRKKLAQIFIQNDIKSIDVVYMEVPCCFGLVHLVHESIKESGKDIPLTLIKVGIRGDIIDTIRPEQGGDR